MNVYPTPDIRTGIRQKRVPIAEVRNLSFIYPEESEPVLDAVNLTLYTGELAILTGPSGCGKSTLCRLLNGIIPHLSSGEILGGEVIVKDKNVARTHVYELATLVGMVHQNPDSQIVCLEVMDELAFGPENMGLSHEEIVSRVQQVIEWVHLEKIANQLTFECSGGQKQRVVIGSSLALLPDLLVLDEPTTDLDPVGAHEVVMTIGSLRDNLGLSFLVVEHDLDELVEVADRLIVMDKGRIVLDAPPKVLFTAHYEDLKNIGLRIPQHIIISHLLDKLNKKKGNFSIHRRDAIKEFLNLVKTHSTSLQEYTSPIETANRKKLEAREPVIKFEAVSFDYEVSRPLIKNINLEIMAGEFVALVGANGSGKSTLARLIIGLLHPQKGGVTVLGMNTLEKPVEDISQYVGYLFQNPDTQLFNTSVEEEIEFGMRLKRLDTEVIKQKVVEVLALLGLEKYRDRHPFALSRGERQRLALATVLVTDPDIIILDEPTTGQDRIMLDSLIGLMFEWIDRKHATILMIAHDMDLVCRYAERTIVMADGNIVADASTEEVFRSNFDLLQDMMLLSPPIVEMSYPLVGSHLPNILLSIEDMEQFLSKMSDNKATNK